VSAIRVVAAGRAALSADVALRVIQEMGNEPKTKPASPTNDPLTSRELEILRLVAQGLTNQDIAERFVVSERTVRTHVSNILGKLHLANRTQAALYALREGIADSPEHNL
jgi:NarL family two-component system response regulator LiaR